MGKLSGLFTFRAGEVKSRILKPAVTNHSNDAHICKVDKSTGLQIAVSPAYTPCPFVKLQDPRCICCARFLFRQCRKTVLDFPLNHVICLKDSFTLSFSRFELLVFAAKKHRLQYSWRMPRCLSRSSWNWI